MLGLSQWCRACCNCCCRCDVVCNRGCRTGMCARSHVDRRRRRWVDGGVTANWTPADEPDADDAAIFNTDDTVNLGSNNDIIG